jgi:RHS repeat-associated protein
VEALLASVGNRRFTGPATAAVAGAREGLWTMRNNPGIAYLCGPKALYSLLQWRKPEAKGLAVLDAYRSGKHGVSLAELESLAKRAGMPYRPAYRAAGAIPVPSLVHWKVNHYAAIVEQQGDRFHVKDPTFGEDLWLTEATIDAQASGYFMVPEEEKKTLQPVALAQAEAVHGQGYTASSDKDRTTPCDQVKSKAPCDGSPKQPGMADYDVHTMLVSLILTDTPLSYHPPKGHPIHFTLRYNQREANQPANFPFSNLGPKWTHNWLTYIEDSPANALAGVKRIVAGGGAVHYGGYDAATGVYEHGVADTAMLLRTASDPIAYERHLGDGSKEIYAFSDGATSGVRRVFLTQKIDAKGHATRLNYDADLRLLSVVDALGQASVLAYEQAGNPRLITGITDPFGRKAVIAYDAKGRLSSITDPIGIVSAFAYDSGDFVKALTTPYGKTTFAYTGNGTSRTLLITDPYGEKERVEFGQALGIPRVVHDVPKGDILTRPTYHDFRNTAYWGKQTYKDYGRAIGKAEISHWLHTIDNKTSGLLETFKKPLENRIWYNHPGQTSANRANNIRQETHSRIGRVLEDGSSQIFIRRFNDYGRPTYSEDPLGHYVKYEYTANQIDLLEVTRLRDGVEELVARYTWDDRHNMLSATDGRGNTTAYTYNAAGQVLTRTNALGQVTRYDYDQEGYLIRLAEPTGKTHRYGYDEAGRLAAYTDTEGHTRTHGYDALNRLVRTRYDDGSERRYTWDRLDLVRIRDRLGRETRFAYDALRRPISETDHMGRTTRYGYDASGRLLIVTDALDHVTRFEYDIQGRKRAAIDAEGQRTEYIYEHGTSRLVGITDAEQGATDYLYDRANRLIAVTDPNRHTTGYRLDEVGNLLQRTSPDSGTTVYRYDVMGQPSEKTDARGITEQYRYDALNRLQQILSEDSAFDVALSYDGTGYAEEVASERRQTALGRLTGMSDASGKTDWYYNLQADIEQIDTFFAGLGERPYSQYFEYDYSYEPGLGRLTRYLYPNGQRFDYRYDASGRVRAIDTTAFAMTKPVVADVAYHPVASDGIAAYTYGNGLSYRREVDALGRLSELTVAGVDNVLDRRWHYTPAGDVAAIDDVLDAGESRSYGYDPLHRLTDATGPFSYSYDANGNRLSKNGALYTPDANSNRLLAIVAGSEVITLEHDGSGNRVRQAGTTGDERSYQYDPRNRLSRVMEDQKELAGYRYNGFGQRVVKLTPNATEYSLYSPEGERISLIGADGRLSHNTFYWHGRPLAHYRPDSAGIYRFTSGNNKRHAALTFAPGQRRLQLTRYDGSRLDVVIEKAQWQVEETGNATVYRFAIEKPGKKNKTQWLKGWVRLDGPAGQGIAHLIDKTEDHSAKKQTYQLKGERVLEDYYYHTDHLGTPQAITDKDQTIVWQARYAPFGDAALPIHAIDNDLRFPGQYFDRETGLHYNWHRYYDPETGSYLTSDPIGLGGGLNTYAYVGASPLNFIDPSGLERCYAVGQQIRCFEGQMGKEERAIQVAFPAINGPLSPAGVGALAAETALCLAPELRAASGGVRLGSRFFATKSTSKELTTFFPPNNGFIGSTTKTTLQPGQTIDRFGGSDVSRFFSPADTPPAMRALPPGTAQLPLRTFEVLKPISVESGQVAPAFNQIGLGTQFRSNMQLGELLEQGFLKEVTQ